MIPEAKTAAVTRALSEQLHVPVVDLRDATFIPSRMPSYKTTLSGQELADVVSYLSSLRNR